MARGGRPARARPARRRRARARPEHPRARGVRGPAARRAVRLRLARALVRTPAARPPEPLADERATRRETALARGAAAVLTVSDGIAEVLSGRGLPDVRVVRNTFEMAGAAADGPLPKELQALVYAGRIGPGRDLETLVRVPELVPGRSVLLVGPADPSYRLPSPLAEGVSVEPAREVDEVDEVYRRGGAAAVTLAAGSANHELALPNKLFHAVRAGVPVVAADLPEIRRTVLRYGFGELYRPGDADLPGRRHAAGRPASARAHGGLARGAGRAVVGARRRRPRRGVPGAGVRGLGVTARRLAVLVANGVHGDSRVQRMARAPPTPGGRCWWSAAARTARSAAAPWAVLEVVLVPAPSVLGAGGGPLRDPRRLLRPEIRSASARLADRDRAAGHRSAAVALWRVAAARPLGAGPRARDCAGRRGVRPAPGARARPAHDRARRAQRRRPDRRPTQRPVRWVLDAHEHVASTADAARAGCGAGRAGRWWWASRPSS